MVRCLEKHLANLRGRQARFAAAHPELGPMKSRAQFWERKSLKLRGSERRMRAAEVSELIRQIKQSQPFWE